MIIHHGHVMRMSPAFSGRPIIFVCERNKGTEAQNYFEHFRQAIEPGADFTNENSIVFPIRQLDNMPTGRKLVHGWWTTAKEKQHYIESVINHMGTARDLRIETNVFSVCPFQLSAVDMTPQKLAKQNVAKLITQCKRYQHVEENSTNPLGMPRTGFSGTVDLHQKKNPNLQDDLCISLGLALRVMDLVRAEELSVQTFPYRKFRDRLQLN